jgi:hypothetical protein
LNDNQSSLRIENAIAWILGSQSCVPFVQLAVNIIKKLGVDPVQTMALAYLLIKFVKGRVGPDIFGMILNKIPLFRLVLDDRNPIVGKVLGALKNAVLR